ncbi:CoxG family protein [Psychromarinibacter sediminicola]|uniref:CoxG family protein n=1 Tax=Psychromarinibacter sediminicola TaxID=3033385 RepID=UPI0028688D81|nr:carbon monoxide dehydrogenase subunit G [Psychromarinibacter sediminicola]
MELSGEHFIRASQEKVWESLNDPETLRRSIPGCESMEQTGENEFTATVVARVGPVEARFKGKVELEDLDPPNGYTLRGRGQGGPAGFAKGTARVTLESESEGTRLRYVANADVGGKLASVGGRLIQSVAKKTAAEFFENFNTVVTGGTPNGRTTGRSGKTTVAPLDRREDSAVTGRHRYSAHIPLIDRVAWLLVGVAVGVAVTLMAA